MGEVARWEVCFDHTTVFTRVGMVFNFPVIRRAIRQVDRARERISTFLAFYAVFAGRRVCALNFCLKYYR